MSHTPPLPLSGKTAVITGGGRGIGAAIAHSLAALGAHSVICGRNPATLEKTAAAIRHRGGLCEAASCDVTSLPALETLARSVEQTFGGCSILVNNAGIAGPAVPLHELAPSDWDSILNTNLRGVFYAIRAFAPMMVRQKNGDIINISSLAGKNALPRGAAYAASKWGLNGLSYSAAEELRAHGIRVTVICPGSVDTELSLHAGKDRSRMLQASDVAHLVEMVVTQSPQSFASEILIRPTQKP